MTRTNYKGDDFGSFGEDWALIELELPEDWVVSKAELKVGNLPVMTFKNPEFPIPLNLNSSQTANLKDVNSCYMAIYDEEGNKRTCDGSWTFYAEDEVV